MDSLFWIREAPRPPQSDEDRIYSQVISAPPKMDVAIYHGAEVDPDASARDGRVRYRNVAMLCKRVAGEKDFVSVPYTDEHARMFPRAAAWWQMQKDKARKVSVQLLPSITPADVAELGELGIDDVEALADADVPAELTHWRDMARRFRTLSKPRMRIVDGALQEVA